MSIEPTGIQSELVCASGKLGKDEDGVDVVFPSETQLKEHDSVASVGTHEGGSVPMHLHSAGDNNKVLVEGHQSPLNDDTFCTHIHTGSVNDMLPSSEKTVDDTKPAMVDQVQQGFEESELKGVEDVESTINKPTFCASDLVWGKVKSHPWWPGQIFEPTDASDKAQKHFRAKSYLVAYFGDHTFAWNDKLKLKPFVPHFPQLVKQTSMDAFRHAVGCALDEVSRRVEFGLSCPCINDDVCSELKIQVMENAGVKEQRIQHQHADRCFTASTFEPVELLDYVSSLAAEPRAEVDKLQHVVARGRISAFYRWKGYYHLPEFGQFIGYVNNEADEKEEKAKVIDDHKVDEATLKEHVSKPRKRKNLSDNGCRPPKKEKCLADMMLEKKVSYKRDRDEKTQGKADRKSISSSSSTRKASKLSNTGLKIEEATGTRITPKDSKSSFRVGESILRVAGELSKPSPLLKKLDVTCTAKGGSKRNKIVQDKEDDISGEQEESRGTEVIDNTEEDPAEEGAAQEMQHQVLGSVHQPPSQDTASECDEKMQPTALTLKFSDIDSIPSEAKLNQIFSHFGALRESETQILTKKICARVVFNRRLDAETAFSSSGKFETFGPSLVCYRLNDVSSSPPKLPSVEPKPTTKEVSPHKGNET